MSTKIKSVPTKFEEHLMELLYTMPPVSVRKNLEEEQPWSNFFNNFLEDTIEFLTQHFKNVNLLASLCKIQLPENPEYEDFLSLHNAIEHEHEMLFIDTPREEQVTRFQILAALDSLFSVHILAKYVLRTEFKEIIEVFLNTKLLMKNICVLAHYHRIAERNQFVAIKDKEKEQAVTEVKQQHSRKRQEDGRFGGKNKYSAEFKLIIRAFLEVNRAGSLSDFEKYFKIYTTTNSYTAKKYEFYRNQKTGIFYRKKVDEPTTKQKEINSRMLKTFFRDVQKEMNIIPK